MDNLQHLLYITDWRELVIEWAKINCNKQCEGCMFNISLDNDSYSFCDAMGALVDHFDLRWNLGEHDLLKEAVFLGKIKGFVANVAEIKCGTGECENCMWTNAVEIDDNWISMCKLIVDIDSALNRRVSSEELRLMFSEAGA